MQTLRRPAAALAATLAVTLLAGTAPARAACAVEGFAYASLDGLPDDPTGPALYLKDSPEAGFASFVRLRDGRFLDRIAGRDGQVRVLVRSDRSGCPTTGELRDLGSALGAPQVLASVGGWLLQRQQSQRPAPETSAPESPTAPTGEDDSE